MISVTLLDGSVRRFDAAPSGFDVASTIGSSLARAALAIKIDGQIRDLAVTVTSDATVEIITATSPEALELIRHDAAHILAEAVQELYPGTQVTFGPATENGFYYDFVRDTPFSSDDLSAIEARMHEIVERDEKIQREEWDRDDAVRLFSQRGENYKAEWIGEIGRNATISIYRQGQWLDLCTGPHLPSTGRLGHAFKLMKVAGAYWRGDARNQQLQRIYGTAFATRNELDAYLKQLEEAEKRDHRRLGREMNLFHFQDEAPGSVFWSPHGWTLFQSLIAYMRKRQNAAGYVEINTPDIMDRSLWELSGHWEKFGDNMFVTEAKEDRVYALKPMNCPGAVQVFKQGIKSYRDLPLHMAEFGKVHRYEPHGALHGLLRVRAFTQDDAHIFCTEDQISQECLTVCDLILSIYRDFGFHDVRIKFSDRPARRVGCDEIWDKSETALKQAVEATGLPYTVNPGEGAFYGPKLEFVLRDAIHRDWQCGTLQVDLNLPGRLGAFYIGEDGRKHVPVMLHRALFGSLERFTGILIEHYAGKLPLWLAPLQIVIATITRDGDEYAHRLLRRCQEGGLRAELDLRNEKISYKIREHSLTKVPVLLVVGKREAERSEVAVRRLDGKAQEILALDEALHRLIEEARSPN